ncbi:TPA: hypothetical protein ACG0BA_004754 [Serratia odorifera]
MHIKSLAILLACLTFSNVARSELLDSEVSSACEYLESGFKGDLLQDLQAFYSCDKMNKDVLSSNLKDLNNRYEFHTASEIHKVAAENEFQAKEMIGDPWGLMTVKVKRVRAIPREDGASLEIYNGGDNPYIFSRMMIPFSIPADNIYFWNEQAKAAKDVLSTLKDGAIINVVCRSDNFRAISSLSESYGVCLYLNSK